MYGLHVQDTQHRTHWTNTQCHCYWETHIVWHLHTITCVCCMLPRTRLHSACCVDAALKNRREDWPNLQETNKSCNTCSVKTNANPPPFQNVSSRYHHWQQHSRCQLFHPYECELFWYTMATGYHIMTDVVVHACSSLGIWSLAMPQDYVFF